MSLEVSRESVKNGRVCRDSRESVEGLCKICHPCICHPLFCVICHPLFVSSATPFFRSFATRTFATPKNLFLILEGVVDKELAKLVEKVNEELVMDVVVEGVVDNR